MEYRDTDVDRMRGWIPTPFGLINKTLNFFRPRKLCRQTSYSPRTTTDITPTTKIPTQSVIKIKNRVKGSSDDVRKSNVIQSSSGSAVTSAAVNSHASSSQITSRSKAHRRKEVRTVTETASLSSTTSISTVKLTAGSSSTIQAEQNSYQEEYVSHSSDSVNIVEDQASSIVKAAKVSVQAGEEQKEVRDRSTGPCPCFVYRTDPVSLRNFKPENHSENCDVAGAHHMSTLHEDYTVISKQNTSLQREVDRLEASLTLLEDTRMASPKHDSVTDVRVVLYGDLGAALTEGLPKNSVTESLYAVNVKLLERLEIEKKKVEVQNEHHDVIVSQLEQLVATVDSFQARFEEHMAEYRASFVMSKASGQSHDAHSSSVKVETDVRNPQFWENLYADGHVSLAHDDVSLDLLDCKKSEAGVTDTLSSQRHAKDEVEMDLTIELQTIVSDLRRVLQDICDRDSQWIDKQKAWVLFVAGLCTKLSVLGNLVMVLINSFASHRSFCIESFAALTNDLSSLRSLTASLAVITPNGKSGRMSDSLSERFVQQENNFRVGPAGGLQAELEELRNDRALLEERYQSTVKRLQNTAQEKLLLESSAEKLKDELTIAQYEKESLLRKNERSLGQVNVMRDTLNDVELDRDRTISEKNELTRDLEKLKLEKDTQVAELRDLDISCRKVAAEKEAIFTELESLSAQRELLVKQLAVAGTLSKNKSHQVAELEDRLMTLHSERQFLLSESSTLKDRDKDLQNRLAQMEIDLLSEQEKGAGLTQSNRRLNEDLQAKTDELAHSLQSVASFLQLKECLVQEIRLVTAKLEEKDNRISELDRLATSTQEELQRARRQLAELQETIDSHNREKDALLSKLGEMATEIDQMQCSASDLTVLLTSKEKELDRVNTKLGAIETEYGMAQGQKEILQKENESLVRHCEQLESQLSQSHSARQEAERRLYDSEAFSEKLRSRLDVESSQLKQGLEQLDENRSLLIAQTEQLQQQLDTAYHQLNEYQVSQESLKRELAERESELDMQKERRVESVRSSDVLREKLAGVLDDNCSLGNAVMVLGQLVSGTSGEELLSPGVSTGDSDSSSQQHRANEEFENLLHNKVIARASSKPLLFPEPPSSQTFEHDSGFVNGSHLDLTFPRRDGSSLHGSSENSVSPLDDFEELVVHHDMATISDNLRKVQQAFLELNTRRDEGEALRQKVMGLEKQSLAQHERYEEVIKELQDSRHQNSILNEKCSELLFNRETMSIAYQQSTQQLRDQEVRTVELKDQLHTTEAEVQRLTRFHVDESNSSSQLSSQNLALSKELDKVRENLQEALKNLESSQKQISGSTQQIQELFEQLAEKNIEVDKLTSAIRNAESRAEAMEQLKAKEKTLVNLQHEIDQKVRRIQERELKLQDLDERAEDIVSMRANLTRQETELLERTRQLSEREIGFSGQEASLGAKLEQILRSEEKLQGMMNALEQRQVLQQQLDYNHEALQKSYADSCMRLSDMEQKLARTEAERSTLEMARSDLESMRSLDSAEAGQTNQLLRKSLEAKDGQITVLLKEQKDSSEELRKSQSENQLLQEQIMFLEEAREGLEQKAADLPEARKLLTEKTKLVATLTAEDKRIRQLLRNAESKLNAFQRTFEDLEERFQTKMQGKDSLETQFNALNILYADTLLKYRTLSDAHDELEIEILRNKDANRDIRREMTKLSDFFRHHLLGGSRTFTIRREDLPDLNNNDASGTKSLITSLRACLEQYLEEQQSSTTMTANLFPPDAHSRPQSASSTGSLRSAPYSPAKGLFSGVEDDELELFRGKVMSKLFFSTSRENITRDELMSMQD